MIIVGNNGSGKSFLAKELSVITGLPLVHLDVEFWRANWEKPSKEEWLKIQMELISKEKWIIDGNHTDTMELRFKAADLVIFLDINRWICLASVFKRYGKKRSDMPRYLEERLDREFLRFIKVLWNFSKTRKLLDVRGTARSESERGKFAISGAGKNAGRRGVDSALSAGELGFRADRYATQSP